MAKALHWRKLKLRRVKAQLINSGRLLLSLRRNGNRKNPKHRLSLPAPPSAQPQPRTPRSPKHAMYRVPDLPVLVGFTIWPEMDRLTLIDCYLRSQWNVCPLKPLSKVPLFSKRRWAKLNRSEKIDIFYGEPDYGVGLWLDSTMTVIDVDSARELDYPTLTAVRGDHRHYYFEGAPEITNSVKVLADDIDTKADGGLIVLPPTMHASGIPYQWEHIATPIPVPAALLDIWRAREYERPHPTVIPASTVDLRSLPAIIREGERDETLWRYGRMLRASGVPFSELSAALHAISERFQPQFSRRQVDAKIRHVWKHRNKPGWKLHDLQLQAQPVRPFEVAAHEQTGVEYR